MLITILTPSRWVRAKACDKRGQGLSVFVEHMLVAPLVALDSYPLAALHRRFGRQGRRRRHGDGVHQRVNATVGGG